jgi:hypothetical protein
VRGPAPPELGIWNDRTALAAWTIENLNSYWTGLAKRAHTALSAGLADDRPGSRGGGVHDLRH